MRYDAENRIIEIRLNEFVSIARRGISPTVSYDEDEPDVGSVARARLCRIFGDMQGEELTLEFGSGDFNFKLTGYADGLSANQITLAKSVLSNPHRLRKSEVAEIRGEGYVLAYMLARECGLDNVSIRFIYLNEASGDFADKTEVVSFKKLDSFFMKCLVAVRIFASPEVERVTERLPSMKRMKFPYDTIREGQSEFVRTAYRTLSRGGCLYATAPTGTGKTVSALYPALRALGD